jgi:glutaredoxin-like protein
MPEKFLDEALTREVSEVFAQLKEPVQVLFFEKRAGCDSCPDTLQLVEEVVSLSAKLSLNRYDIEADAAVAARYGVEKAPTLVFAAQDRDYGIHFAGMPSGHEFSSLIHDLILVSSRDSGLDPKVRQLLNLVTEPVHLQVFVTPTCPYCPRAVVLAHQLALESPWIVAEGVEAMEFPELADRFHVSGVPQTTINAGAGTVVGAVPAENLIAAILQAVAANGNQS